MVAVPMLTLSQELPAKKLLQRNISISTSIIISTTIIIFKLMFIVTVISHFLSYQSSSLRWTPRPKNIISHFLLNCGSLFDIKIKQSIKEKLFDIFLPLPDNASQGFL